MKLELKYLAPYLHYKLNWNTLNGNLWTKETMIGVTKDVVIFSISEDNDLESSYDLNYIGDGGMKPVLRPLSDLNKQVDNDKNNVSYAVFADCGGKERTENAMYTPLTLSYEKLSKLLFHHFDVFGLIEKGLAIDINTLKN